MLKTRLSIGTDRPMQTVLRSDTAEKEGTKQVSGNRVHGNLENTFRIVRHATSEDSDYLLMQRQSDIAVCGDKPVCKLQFLDR